MGAEPEIRLLSLSIGSNIDAENNIRSAITQLRILLPGLRLSSVYESEAVGFDGDNFLNLVACADTELPLTEISAALKRIEDQHGRDRSAARFSGRTLDIDILTYGDVVGDCAGISLPRGEILSNAFVLQPLAELLPEACHPQSGQSFAKLWHSYDKSKQRLWTIEFPFQ